MPRSFEILAESLASVEQLHAAFGREDYWLACIEGGGNANNRVTLDSLTVDDDGTVSVRSTQHVGRQLLPGPVLKLLPGDLKIVNCETWKPVGDGRVHGQSSISAPVGSGEAEVWLSPTSNGSRLRYAVKVEVKIPLVGGKFEKAIGASLTKSIPAGLQFAEAWIAEHA
ncbi:hypothetical protein A5791_00270 [Mycobacterium sp. 852002-51163_SCH5372311]|uniref:DUF2505 domain-containing protein n=1 Tax=Mycobacterium sp. 852002-51163_SCH5372311 TaxID=1834097 RepID=UPI000800D49F|nr:DUF2505 domain-containing protein [Mycobacterium sp. 852002-51163_SCH5372311]OBF81523.1 hypothetical protein A5791_00270 [Mycobacterium sp. 852002-51163_SCH5372311]